MAASAAKPVPATVTVVVGGPAPGDNVTAGAASAVADDKSKTATTPAQRVNTGGTGIVDTSIQGDPPSGRKHPAPKIPARQVRQRLLALNGRQCHLRLECRCVVPS